MLNPATASIFKRLCHFKTSPQFFNHSHIHNESVFSGFATYIWDESLPETRLCADASEIPE
jgi:hypothetical protein